MAHLQLTYLLLPMPRRGQVGEGRLLPLRMDSVFNMTVSG